MEIKTELLKKYISDYINFQFKDFEIEADKIADSAAINILAEIQNIIKNDIYSDFEKVENIVSIFENNKLDFGNCHDF